MGRRVTAIVLAMLGMSSCGSSDVFVCSDDSSCPGGQCEVNGYCSFPADDCPSGQRYGEFSGPFADQCVMESDDGATSGASNSGVDGSGSSASTTTSATDGQPPMDDSSSAAEPPSTCDGGETCFEIPDGWDGPAHLFTAEQSCSDVVAQGATSYAGNWTCSCSCDVGGPMSCDGVPVLLQLFEGNSACQGGATLVTDLTTACEDFGDGGSYSILTTAEGDADCDSTAQLVTSPVAPVDSRVVCDASGGAACAGGVCASDTSGLCIHAEGERTCPDGFERTLIYTSFDDTRGCSACDCDARYSCGGTISLASQGCAGSGTVTIPMGCSNFQTTVIGGRVASYSNPPAIECESAGGDEMGGIASSGPRTVCCAP